MESLLALDQQLFIPFNHLPHTAVLDGLAQFFSGIGNAGIVWFVLGLWLIPKEEKKDHLFFPRLLVTGAIVWMTQWVLKELIRRPRPGGLDVINVGVELTDFAFPSGHAMIAWSMAIVLARKEKRWRLGLFVLAALISFSRIYLGKHYPLDVLAGGLIGWAIAEVVLRILQKKGI